MYNQLSHSVNKISDIKTLKIYTIIYNTVQWNYVAVSLDKYRHLITLHAKYANMHAHIYNSSFKNNC